MRTVDLSRAIWRKSSRSGQNGNCVEVASNADSVAVRDSKDPAGARLTVSAGRWSSFMAELTADRLTEV